MIALCAILFLAPEVRSEIKITPKTYTISGNIGIAGVTLQGFPGKEPVQTDQNGVYSAVVEWGWDGTVTPIKQGYDFLPKQKVYKDVKADMTSESYTATPKTFTVSGLVGEPGVKMIGFPVDVVTGPDGRYSATVTWGMDYTITPEKLGWQFNPPSMTFNQVKQNFVQDFKATELKFTISGLVGEPGVEMKGLPTKVMSGPDGRYTTEVRYGFSGTVTPTKEGCTFIPESRPYEAVNASLPNEDYSVTVLTYTISGSAGQPGVNLVGFPDKVVTDDMGYYTAIVRWGWDGTVKPEKAGWTFTPASTPYKDVTASVENANYNPTRVFLTIEGNTGIGQVILSGFPGADITSDERGAYSVQVEYDWTGQVVPQKEGYEFTPADKPFAPVTQNLSKQDFQARKIAFEISGSIQPPLPGIVLRSKELPGKSIPVGADGFYKFEVEYNWTGSVAPVKAGYTFQPPEYAYPPVLLPQTNQNYVAEVVRHAISGKVTEKDGTPVPDVLMVAEGPAGVAGPVESVVTGVDGAFEISVPQGWSGRITPQNPAWIFSPPMKPFSAVGGPVTNQTILAEKKMLTISDVLKYGSEPIQGVQVTATPGDYKAETDATGRFTVRVPYGWTGELSFFKEDLNIEGTKPYTDVTENIDETKPKPVTPSSFTQQGTTQQGTTQQRTTQQGTTQQGTTQQGTTQQGTTQQGATQQGAAQQGAAQQGTAQQGAAQQGTTQQGAAQQSTTQRGAAQQGMGQEEQAPAEILTTRDLLQQRLTAIQKEMDALPLDQTGQARFQVLMAQYAQIAAMIRGQMPVDMGVLNQGQQAGGQSQTPVVVGPTTPMLLSVLAELSKQTNTKIAVDLTVKDEPIPMGAASVQGLPMNLALDTILKATKRSYIYRTLPDGTYQIFHPITNTFIAQDLVTALADIAAEAEVGITPDPNVAGTTSADFKEQPLEGALSRVLAGTGFVFRRMDDYYLVGDRSPDSPSYPDISVTQFVKTNHTLPVTIKNLLPEQYQLYVKAEAASTTDPNDQGHFLTVTAPQSLSDKIMHMIKNLDVSRRQILLDARVVTMERGNELNLGVEWGFPTMNAGLFYDGDTTSKGVQIGYSVDQTFTNSLMATLNLLEATNQADIVAHPQLVAQDGSQAQLRTIQEEWFMMTANQFANNPYGYVNSELQKVESGTVITITPYIGDGNEITLKMAIEVSDSIPRGAASDLPIVTRRQAKNEVTVKNGGTVAVAGLTETRGRNVEKRVPFLGNLPLIGAAFRNKDDLKSTREVAVFVTASLVDGSDLTRMKNQSPDTAIGAGAGVTPSGIRSQPQPSQGMTREDLAAALQRTQ